MDKDPGANSLYDYLFHYNPHTKMWSGFKREDKSAYFNGTEPKTEILKAKDIKTLWEYISKNNK